MVVFAVARTGFFLANLFYDAMLVDVSRPHTSNFISSLGFGMGYLGGGILFVLNLLMYTYPGAFGFSSRGAAIQFSFLLVFIWWILFSIPLFAIVKQRASAPPLSAQAVIHDGMKRLKATARDILRLPSLLLFLIAYWFYIDGVNTVYMMATDYGLSIGIDLATLMLALLIVQFVAFPSALFFAYIADTIGAQKTILISIGIYAVIAGFGSWMIKSGIDFIVFACLTATAQGAIQALSRSLFANMVPRGRETDFFGFYNMVGKFAVIVGPALIGGVNLICHARNINAITSARLGVSSIALLFIVGGVLLLKVRTGTDCAAQPHGLK
jgi:UMF1 family MFS transporter